MGSRWQLRVPRAEDEREHNPVRGVIHNIHRIKPPLPRTPSPFYRHLFLRGRGRATITEVHLNLPPGLTPQPGSPQPALLASPTLTVDTIPRFRPNQSSSKGGPNLPLLTSIEMTPDASAVVTFHRIHWKGSPESAIGGAWLPGKGPAAGIAGTPALMLTLLSEQARTRPTALRRAAVNCAEQQRDDGSRVLARDGCETSGPSTRREPTPRRARSQRRLETALTGVSEVSGGYPEVCPWGWKALSEPL